MLEKYRVWIYVGCVIIVLLPLFAYLWMIQPLQAQVIEKEEEIESMEEEVRHWQETVAVDEIASWNNGTIKGITENNQVSGDIHIRAYYAPDFASMVHSP